MESTMKKDVLINIKGVQRVSEEQDVTELFTQGSFYKKNDSYYVSYSESEATGYGEGRTTIKIDPQKRVTLVRSGPVKSHLVIVPGQRNVGHYAVDGGDLMIGVDAKAVTSTLTDEGGDLYFAYALDVNASLLSENEVFINVKENVQE